MPLLAPRGDDWAHEPTRFRRALNWFRHRSNRIVIILGGVWFADNVTANLTRHGPMFVATAILALPIVFTWFYAVYEAGVHTMRWCDSCVWKRVGEDGAEGAQKKRKLLHFFHLRYDHLKIFIPVTLTFSAGLIFTHGLVNLVVFAAWSVWFATTSWSDTTHSWYQFHCPWCRDDDGGDDDVIVPDMPVPGTPATPDMVKS
jgi:hypothetical protein